MFPRADLCHRYISHVLILYFVSNQDPLVETYTSEDIESTLGLQRQHMIALALLVGCDYDTKGVLGIGCSHAMRLVSAFSNEEVLDRWVECFLCLDAIPSDVLPLFVVDYMSSLGKKLKECIVLRSCLRKVLCGMF